MCIYVSYIVIAIKNLCSGKIVMNAHNSYEALFFWLLNYRQVHKSLIIQSCGFFQYQLM